MKIEVIVFKDEKTNLYTGFFHDFPGICAQSDTLQDLQKRLRGYMNEFVETKLNPQIENFAIDETNVAVMA